LTADADTVVPARTPPPPPPPTPSGAPPPPEAPRAARPRSPRRRTRQRPSCAWNRPWIVLPQGVRGWRLCSRVTRSAISLGCIVGHAPFFPATVGVTTAWFHSAATTAAEESRPLARVRSLAGLPRSP